MDQKPCVSFAKGLDIIGIDNDMRSDFFGEASTKWNRLKLEKDIPNYKHIEEDIEADAIMNLFMNYQSSIAGIIHAAAQPSHDWAFKDPLTDFTNTNGTIILLEMTRKYCPDAVFIFTSTNKVYGDAQIIFHLLSSKLVGSSKDPCFSKYGIDESMSIDQTKHSVFGSSKVAADIMVQEYGRYFGLKTGVFRGGCLTGPAHSGTELHGF